TALATTGSSRPASPPAMSSGPNFATRRARSPWMQRTNRNTWLYHRMESSITTRPSLLSRWTTTARLRSRPPYYDALSGPKQHDPRALRHDLCLRGHHHRREPAGHDADPNGFGISGIARHQFALGYQ